MHFISAYERATPALQKAIEDGKLADVELHKPFLGRVVVRCGSEASLKHLQNNVDGLLAA